MQYPVINALSRLNRCNSFKHYRAILVEDKMEEEKSEDREFAHFSDLPV